MNDDTPQQGLGPDELAAILKREFEVADQYYDQLEPLQDAAFRFYEAQPFGNEVDGRSQIVLPDVQETCDYMSQSVLRTFLSGDRAIEFEATDEADEQAVDDATAGIDYRFMREQDGPRVLNDVVQDGNLKMLGIFKVLCEYEETVSREWQEMPAEVLGMIPEELEVEQVREADEGMVRALIKTQTANKVHRIVAVPTAEFRFSPRAKHEDEADYIAHVRLATRSELVEMGFDQEQVYSLPTHNGVSWQRTESATLDYDMRSDSSEALEEVLLCEEYARIDVDGDGIAERVQCYRVENEILIWGDKGREAGELAIETVDEQPFAVFCPFPRPHRLVGYALAQKVMDIQLARSEVARQMFDGMAFANMPRPIVASNGSSDETMDDILSPIPGSPVRVQDVGAISTMPNTFDIGASLNAMEWITGERESRTGITRMNQGLDADALNKTASGTAMMKAAGEQFEEYIARNLAEAFGRAAGKLYRMMRVEAEPFTIKVDGKYRVVDPSTWPESVNIRVRVGLGTGAKDKRVAARMALQEPLVLLKQEGLAGPEHIYNWVDGYARDTGIGRGDDFMYDPADPEFQQMQEQKGQQPDPKMAEVQGKLELEAQRAQATAELDREKVGAQAQLDREKAEADIQTERQRAAMQMQVMREKAALEMELARDKAAAEMELAERRMAFEAQMKRQMADATVPQNRPGGSLAE